MSEHDVDTLAEQTFADDFRAFEFPFAYHVKTQPPIFERFLLRKPSGEPLPDNAKKSRPHRDGISIIPAVPPYLSAKADLS